MKAIVKPGKLPETLRALRLRCGFSQREAAELFGFNSPAIISHYETGRRRIPVELIPDIEVVYGVKIEIVISDISE